ncbi:MAG: addiction module protein [Hyphomicrobiaceae bacterium]
MTIRLNEVTTQALHLSADDRITLIEAIMRSLEVDGPNTEQGWSQDIKDRISAFRLSGIETVDFGDYLRKYEVK